MAANYISLNNKTVIGYMCNNNHLAISALKCTLYNCLHTITTTTKTSKFRLRGRFSRVKLGPPKSKLREIRFV